MIGKVIRGRRVPRLLAYLYGPGRHCEHEDPHTVAGWDDPAVLEPATSQDGRRDTSPLAVLLEEPVWAGRRRSARPVWQCVLRAAPGDRWLSDPEWRQVAEDVMHRTGLARRGDLSGCRWVAVRHADDHIHIVATLARQDGARVGLHNDFYRVGEACAAAERRLGLAPTAGRDRTAARRPSRAETERARRLGRPEPARDTVRRRVVLAAAGAAGEAEFLDRLRGEGLLVRLRESQRDPGEITGYAVALADYQAADGRPVWFGGGTLAADLSLPRLRRRWADPVAAPRVRLREVVRSAAEHSLGVQGFAARLRGDGVGVRLRYSTRFPGQVTGYAVTLPGVTGAGGGPVWFGGATLAADLSLPKLTRRWAEPTEPTRAQLRATVRTAAEQSTDADGFLDLLRRAGLLVRARESVVAAGEIGGYAVASPALAGRDGQPVWFGGATLAPDLSLPALRRRWRTGLPPAARAGRSERPAAGPPRSARDRVRLIEQAAERAAGAAEQLRRCAAGDPQAASVAQAAADVYAAAARVLDGRSGGALTDAAQAYLRAARQPWGDVPPRTAASVDLRHSARSLLLVGRLATAGESHAMLALLLQLAAAAEALALLRDTQHRAAQAAAARRASEAAAAAHQTHLAAALPDRTPRPGRQPEPAAGRRAPTR